MMKVKSLSASLLESSPLSHIDAAEMAPVGYPQTVPRKTAHAAAFEVPKSILDGRENTEPSSRSAPSSVIIDEMTIKGKTDGITVVMHKEMPFLICSAHSPESAMAQKMTRLQTSADRSLPHLFGSDLLGLMYFICILVLPFA